MGEQFLRRQGSSLILETSLDTILQSNQTPNLKNVVTLCFFLRLVSAYSHNSTATILHLQIPSNEEEPFLGCRSKRIRLIYGNFRNKGIVHETGGNDRFDSDYQGICCL